MKLGQLLSLQGDDLLSPGLRETLASLQNHAHFMPEAQVRQVLSNELGRDWKTRLAEFDFEPLAAASIGQVHAAQSRDRRDLALKLQYPGVERSIDGDVDNLALLAETLRLVPPGSTRRGAARAEGGAAPRGRLLREARSQEQYRASSATTRACSCRACTPTSRPDACSPATACARCRSRTCARPSTRSGCATPVGEALRLGLPRAAQFRFVQTDRTSGTTVRRRASAWRCSTSARCGASRATHRPAAT